MTLEIKPLAEITDNAIKILYQELGVVNTVRFLNQFSSGYGNYTEDRKDLFRDVTLDQIVAEIKQARSQ